MPAQTDYFDEGVAKYNRGQYQAALKDFNQAVSLRGNASDYHGRGVTYFKLSLYQAALKDFNQVISRRDNAIDYHWRGITYYELAQYQAALKDLHQAVSHRGNADDYYWRGTAYYKLAQYQAALKDLHQAVSLRGNARDYYRRGVTYYELAQYQAALKDLNQAISLQGNADDYHGRGSTYYKLAQYQAALKDFNQAVSLRGNALDYHWRGITYFKLSQYQAALKDLDQAVSYRGNADDYHGRGVTYFKLSQYQAALKDFDKAVSHRGNADDYYWRGITYFKRNRYQAALKDLHQAVSHRGNADDYYGRGVTYFKLSQYQTALKDLNQVISRRGDADDYYCRGLTYYNLSQYQAALKDLHQAVSHRGNADDYHGRGMTYYELTRYPEALNDFNQAISHRGNALDYHGRGRTYQSLLNPSAAENDFRSAIQLKGETADDYYGRSKAHYSLGNYQAALNELQQAIALNKHQPNPYHYYWQSKVYNALGNYVEAYQLCQKALQLHPHQQEMKDHLQQIEQNLAEDEQLKQQVRVSTLHEQACLYLEKGAFSEAVKTCQAMVTYKTDYAPYYFMLSKACLGLKDAKAALEAITVAMKLDNTSVEYMLQRALCYQAVDEWDAALADYECVITLNPEQQEAYEQAGFILFNQQQYPQAIKRLSEAIAKQADATEKPLDLYLARAKAYLYMEQYDKSLQDIEHALQTNPLDITAHLLTGFNQSAKGKYQSAIAAFNNVLRKDSSHSNGRFNRAYCYQQLGEYTKALNDYNLLVNQLEQAQDQALLGIVLFSRGSSYQAMGRSEQAYQDLQWAKNHLSKRPHPELLWLAPVLQLAIVDQGALIQATQEEKQRKLQAKALEFVFKAEVYLEHGTLDLAMQQCEQALAINSACAEAYWLRGSLCQRQNRWDEAFSCFLTVENLNPNFQGIQSALANAKKQWDSEQEKMAYQRWLKEEAPDELFNAILQGLHQGVTMESDSKFPPLYGLCEKDEQLSPASIELLQKAFTRVLFTSQLLTQHFERAHQAIIVYKIVERWLTLFASQSQPPLSSPHKVALPEVSLKSKITLQQIEQQMSTALLRARDYIKQQTLQQREQQALHENPVTFFSQPKASHLIPSDLHIKTIFARPLESQLAVVALLRAKANEHALLVVMQLSDNNILQMFGYHFRPHPDNKRSGIVHIAQEKIIVSPADTEEQLLRKQDEVLLNRKFAEFPSKDCEFQAFSLSLEQVQQLHEAVKRDFARNGQNPIPYFLYGDKSIFAPSVSHQGHSCFTWAREKLKNIELPISEDWTDYFVARTSYHLKNEKRCLIM